MIALTSHEFFQYSVTVATLVVLEGLLSADNALVLAVLVRNLPKEQQSKALHYGIWGAFFFRFVGVLLAGQLIRFWYLKGIGALYLIYLAIIHFWRKWRVRANSTQEYAVAKHGFWRTVIAVELTDIAFSVDSIIAAVALSPNIYIVYLGGVLGIITMRFVATWFIRLLEIYSALETSAYLLVGWIGIKLLVEIIDERLHPAHTGEHAGMSAWLFWSVMAVVFIGGFLVKKKTQGQEKDPTDAQAP